VAWALAPNTSLGVFALTTALRALDRLLPPSMEAAIFEVHHAAKKDAPSGTALSIQRVISPAGPGNVQTQSIRAGEIIGDHEITFYGPGDHLTIGHFAQDRSIFARGAIDAALWLAGKRGSGSISGLIGMEAFFRETVAKSLRPSV
jgi:4-hydroxy-tetrahydrodipicolinate reductase